MIRASCAEAVGRGKGAGKGGVVGASAKVARAGCAEAVGRGRGDDDLIAVVIHRADELILEIETGISSTRSKAPVRVRPAGRASIRGRIQGWCSLP